MAVQVDRTRRVLPAGTAGHLGDHQALRLPDGPRAGSHPQDAGARRRSAREITGGARDMTHFLIANLAPLMFTALVVGLLIGYPVAFSLGAVGLSFGFL